MGFTPAILRCSPASMATGSRCGLLPRGGATWSGPVTDPRGNLHAASESGVEAAGGPSFPGHCLDTRPVQGAGQVQAAHCTGMGGSSLTRNLSFATRRVAASWSSSSSRP
eukprot:1847841-Pyramimonas_sp.AAC.1